MSRLSSALAFAAFVGDLFSQHFINQASVHHCLSVLLAKLSAVEHIYAIHALLLHANKTLWHTAESYQL
ncbi:hypothetical protein SERLA73DRAFT_138506, partial [Serpula lacrymans var. lacrymans S7.3]